MSATTTPTQTERARRFSELAKAARGTAIINHTKGDGYGEALATARAEVYEACADLASIQPEADAAAEMMRRAQEKHVRTPPIMGFDEAGLNFVVARAYQFCAWQIDPSLEQVAKAWD